MPKFLNRAELYRLIQRELPEGAYPDGTPSAYFATADSDAFADVSASAYGNLENIYENYWPQSAVERLTDHERTVFGKPLSAALSLSERRDRVIAKYRAKKGIRKQDMVTAVQAIIGTDKDVRALNYNCGDGSWRIGISLLGVSTYLGAFNTLLATGPNLCSQGPEDFGLTEEEWEGMQRQAYTFEIQIYSYTLTAAELAAIDEVLTAAEPARSTHVIRDNLTP